MEACSYYQKALEYPLPVCVKDEISTILLSDWYTGSKKAAVYGKKTDVTEYLDFWLDKYESLENIRQLADKLCE